MIFLSILRLPAFALGLIIIFVDKLLLLLVFLLLPFVLRLMLLMFVRLLLRLLLNGLIIGVESLSSVVS